MLATPVSVTYYIYHCIGLLLANAHSHIEELVVRVVIKSRGPGIFPCY